MTTNATQNEPTAEQLWKRCSLCDWMSNAFGLSIYGCTHPDVPNQFMTIDDPRLVCPRGRKVEESNASSNRE